MTAGLGKHLLHTSGSWRGDNAAHILAKCEVMSTVDCYSKSKIEVDISETCARRTTARLSDRGRTCEPCRCNECCKSSNRRYLPNRRRLRVAGGLRPIEVPMPKTSVTPATPIPSKRQLAAMCGVSRMTVGRWTRHPEWPLSRVGPWRREDVPRILRWCADTLKPSTVCGIEPTGLRREKLEMEVRKLAAQAATVESALARIRSKLIDAAEARNEFAAITGLVRDAFADLAAAVAQRAVALGMPCEAAPHFTEQASNVIADILAHLTWNVEDSLPPDTGTKESNGQV